jgi:hypothetical protein
VGQVLLYDWLSLLRYGLFTYQVVKEGRQDAKAITIYCHGRDCATTLPEFKNLVRTALNPPPPPVIPSYSLRLPVPLLHFYLLFLFTDRGNSFHTPLLHRIAVLSCLCCRVRPLFK